MDEMGHPHTLTPQTQTRSPDVELVVSGVVLHAPDPRSPWQVPRAAFVTSFHRPSSRRPIPNGLALFPPLR